MTTKRQAAAIRKRAKKELFYQDAYDVLKTTINFKDFSSFEKLPSKGRVIVGISDKESGYEQIKEPGYKFTPAQKAMLSKLAIDKNKFDTFKQREQSEGRSVKNETKLRQAFRTTIYNKSEAVKNGAYTLVKLSKKQKDFFKQSANNTVTNKGLILPNKAINAKPKKIKEGYTISYTVPKKDGAESKRKEIYFPFPDNIKADPNLMQAYMQRVFDILKPSNFQMAVNTHHGLTTHHPKLLNSYLQQLKEYQKGGDVYEGLSGFYLVTHKADSPDEMMDKINADEIINEILDGLFEPEYDDGIDFDELND